MRNITIQYGVESANKQVMDGTTIGQVLADSNIKALLGYGDNVKVLIDGVEMPTDAVLGEGDVIRIETAANTKAVLA